MLGIPDTRVKTVHKAFKELKHIRSYVKAYELLFDAKPRIFLKGRFYDETNESMEANYDEVDKIGSQYIIFKINTNRYTLTDDGYYQVKLVYP